MSLQVLKDTRETTRTIKLSLAIEEFVQALIGLGFEPGDRVRIENQYDGRNLEFLLPPPNECSDELVVSVIRQTKEVQDLAPMAKADAMAGSMMKEAAKKE